MGLTFEKINPEVLFYGTSRRNFMFFEVLPDSNSKLKFQGYVFEGDCDEDLEYCSV